MMPLLVPGHSIVFTPAGGPALSLGRVVSSTVSFEHCPDRDSNPPRIAPDQAVVRSGKTSMSGLVRDVACRIVIHAVVEKSLLRIVIQSLVRCAGTSSDLGAMVSRILEDLS